MMGVQVFTTKYETRGEELLESTFQRKKDIVQHKFFSTASPKTVTVLKDVSSKHLVNDQELKNLISHTSSKSMPCCKDCGQVFREVNNLLTILLNEKTEEVSKQQSIIVKGHYRCKICAGITNEKEDMRRHILNHISEGDVACEECLENVRLNTKERELWCTHCYKTISDRSKVATKPSDRKISESSERKMESKSNSQFDEEQNKGSTENTIICEECEKEMNQRSKNSKETGTSRHSKIPLVYFSKPVQCRTCDRVFSDVGQLIKEFVTSESRRSVTAIDVTRTFYTCNICKLKSIDGLNEHIANHAASKDFFCSDCLGAMINSESSCSSRSTSTITSEKGPAFTTTTNGNNKCVVCHESLDMSEELAFSLMRCELDTDKHLYYYHCNICTARRSSKCLLTRHLKKHVKENVIKCLKCKGMERYKLQ